MADKRHVLAGMYTGGNRYANFGNVLDRILICGFRAHANTVIDIRSPITAICGLNGTGKSTVLQIAAAAYKKPHGSFYFKNFFVVSGLDPAPYKDDASVVYNYCEADGKLGQVTIARNPGGRRKGWSGYKRRRERSVFYGGVGMFIPKVEKRDFLVYGAANLQVDGETDVPPEVSSWTARVLGRIYDGMSAVQAHVGNRNGRVLRLTRNAVGYTEAHMGFGEGRVAYLIENLETIPERSLVLIEEPETSLHPSAQHTLGAYLMDVCVRRKHQVILTTHSEHLLRALPSVSRIYFDWKDGQLQQLVGLTASQAAALMAEGHDRSLTVLVEDGCARALLAEMIRRVDPAWLRSIYIQPAGDHDSICTTMRCLKNSGIQVAAVLDGDQSARPKESIYTLPGTEPPEKVVMALPAVKEHLRATYSFNWDDFASSEGLASVDHHEWIKRLGQRVSVDPLSLTTEIARLAAQSFDATHLVTLLKAAACI
jgi:predicted ATPase